MGDASSTETGSRLNPTAIAPSGGSLHLKTFSGVEGLSSDAPFPHALDI